MYHYIIILSTDSVNYFVIKSSKGAWDKNHFGFLLHAQKLINGGNRSNSFGNKPKFSKIIEQFSEIPSYFSELNTSVPTSLLFFIHLFRGLLQRLLILQGVFLDKQSMLKNATPHHLCQNNLAVIPKPIMLLMFLFPVT